MNFSAAIMKEKLATFSELPASEQIELAKQISAQSKKMNDDLVNAKAAYRAELNLLKNDIASYNETYGTSIEVKGKSLSEEKAIVFEQLSKAVHEAAQSQGYISAGGYNAVVPGNTTTDEEPERAAEVSALQSSVSVASPEPPAPVNMSSVSVTAPQPPKPAVPKADGLVLGSAVAFANENSSMFDDDESFI